METELIFRYGTVAFLAGFFPLTAAVGKMIKRWFARRKKENRCPLHVIDPTYGVIEQDAQGNLYGHCVWPDCHKPVQLHGAARLTALFRAKEIRWAKKH